MHTIRFGDQYSTVCVQRFLLDFILVKYKHSANGKDSLTINKWRCTLGSSQLPHRCFTRGS